MYVTAITSGNNNIELQVSYQGVPEKTYEVFVNALQSVFLAQGVDIPPLEDHNPAGNKHFIIH